MKPQFDDKSLAQRPIIIYANLHSGFGSGGIQTYLAALIFALGRLTDGPEEYLILGPIREREWIDAVCGPNQRVIPLPYTQPGIGRRVANRGVRFARRAKHWASSLPLFTCGGYGHVRYDPTLTANGTVPISTGWIESLNPSVIHFPYQEFIVTSVPSIYNPHDLAHLHLPQCFDPSVIGAREACYPFACRVANRIAVASEWIAKDLSEKYGVPTSKVVTIPWAAATSAFPGPTNVDVAAVRAKYELSDRFALYPAVAWPHKNHTALIQAMSRLRGLGCRMDLVCSGAKTSLTESLASMVKQLELTKQVRFLDHIPSNEMRSLYAAANQVVVPTLFEAVSGPVAEAWQEGVPVACSDLPQLREQAGSAALYFNQRSPDDIAGCIARLSEDVDLRSGLIRSGYSRLAEVSWDQTARRYRELYRQLGCQPQSLHISDNGTLHSVLEK